MTSDTAGGEGKGEGRNVAGYKFGCSGGYLLDDTLYHTMGEVKRDEETAAHHTDACSLIPNCSRRVDEPLFFY